MFYTTIIVYYLAIVYNNMNFIQYNGNVYYLRGPISLCVLYLQIMN